MKTAAAHILAQNRKALFDYEVVETYEAGIRLTGPEVRSLRLRQANLKGAFVIVRSSRAFVVGMHIANYKFAQDKLDPYREREIFLKSRTILHLTAKSREKGFTMVPLEVYTKGNLIKVKVALVQGRKKHDKKELLKQRDITLGQKREVAQYFRNR